MALPTTCQTPGAVYHTHIGITTGMPPRRTVIEARVELPIRIQTSVEEAALLEANIHNALELVLAPYFKADLTV